MSRVTEKGQTATEILIQEGFIVHFNTELFESFPKRVVTGDLDGSSILESGIDIVLTGRMTTEEALAYVRRTAPKWIDHAKGLIADGLIPYKAVAE